MGPVAIDADDVARHVNSHRWDPGRRTEWLEQLKPIGTAFHCRMAPGLH